MAKFYKKLRGLFAGDTDSGIINFCKTEYGSDWYWAYATYQNKGKFPSIFNRKI